MLNRKSDCYRYAGISPLWVMATCCTFFLLLSSSFSLVFAQEAPPEIALPTAPSDNTSTAESAADPESVTTESTEKSEPTAEEMLEKAKGLESAEELSQPKDVSDGFFSSLFGGEDDESGESAEEEAVEPEVTLPTEEEQKAEADEAEAKKKQAEAAKKELEKKKELAKKIPLPKRKPFKTYRSQNLPRTISKRHYAPDNSHLPPAAYIGEHVHLLFNAIRYNSIHVVRSLVEKYKGVDVRDREGNTPLLYATTLGNAQIVAMLVGMYADPNVHNVYLSTPLHAAATGGRTDITSMLLKAGAIVNEQNQSGMTPLMIAAERGFTGVMEQLIAEKAKLELRRKDGNTALHLACATPRPEACYTLLKKGANTEARNFEGLTPLMLAAKLGNQAAVTMLLKRGADVKTADASGRTASHLAMSSGYARLAGLIDTEDARRQKLADRVKEIRTYGRYQPRETASYHVPVHKAVRVNGVPLPIAKPRVNGSHIASAPVAKGGESSDFLPMYKAPIPRYLPPGHTYYGNNTVTVPPHPERAAPMSTPYATSVAPENRVPSSIPAYNNAPPPPLPENYIAPESLQPAPKSPGGANPMRMYRYF